MNPILTNCPVCSGELLARRLQCQTCNTAIEGTFMLGRLGRLTREQLHFVELLAQHRGNVNQVAAALSVSYTTARTRMDEIVTALGVSDGPSSAPTIDQQTVLKRLESGEISAEEALNLLQELKRQRYGSATY